MGLLPASGEPKDVDFFKIDESTYSNVTGKWGTDVLMENKNLRTVTIPSDIKAGTYVVRHEIISLHNALNDDYVTKKSGAQFYPQCIRIRVTGTGTATPPGGKFPGTYKWDDKGILVNIFYRANEYISPGPVVYKSAVVAAPVGPKPATSNVEETAAYTQAKAKSDKMWQAGVHMTDAARTLIPTPPQHSTSMTTDLQQIPEAEAVSGMSARTRRPPSALLSILPTTSTRALRSPSSLLAILIRRTWIGVLLSMVLSSSTYSIPRSRGWKSASRQLGERCLLCSGLELLTRLGGFREVYRSKIVNMDDHLIHSPRIA